MTKLGSLLLVVAAVAVGHSAAMLRGISIGFTAPSTSFEGATISLECIRYFDGDLLSDTHWLTNVFAAEGGWVDHPEADTMEEDLESLISVLAPFYDGTSLWTLEDTEKTFTFWEMVLRTQPENLM